MKTESALTDHFAGLQEIADTITRLREDNARLLAALKWCEMKLFAMGHEFSGPRFTDRHGDGPEMLRLAELARVAICQAERVQ